MAAKSEGRAGRFSPGFPDRPGAAHRGRCQNTNTSLRGTIVQCVAPGLSRQALAVDPSDAGTLPALEAGIDGTGAGGTPAPAGCKPPGSRPGGGPPGDGNRAGASWQATRRRAYLVQRNVSAHGQLQVPGSLQPGGER